MVLNKSKSGFPYGMINVKKERTLRSFQFKILEHLLQKVTKIAI